MFKKVRALSTSRNLNIGNTRIQTSHNRHRRSFRNQVSQPSEASSRMTVIRCLAAAVLAVGLWPGVGLAGSGGTEFADVTSDHWAAPAIGWAVEEGITQGTDAGRFEPDGLVTRAQIVTFLHRMAGLPDGSLGSDTFMDLPAGHWADRAVGWAVEEGITQGTGAGRFEPDGLVTRAQIVTFLHRMAGLPDGNAGSGIFDDIPAGHWADRAVGWAADQEIATGIGGGRFGLDQSIIRARIVTYFYRYAGPPDADGHSRTLTGSGCAGGVISRYRWT